MKIEEKEFSLTASDGQTVRGVYRDTGEGPVGAFLHGLLSDAAGTKSMTLWDHAVQSNRSWIRFDMRAHGQSDGKFEQFNISRAVEDTRLVFEQFSERPSIVVGSSMGGWVAAQCALDPAFNIAGLVLIAPAFNFIQDLYASLDAKDKSLWKSTGSRLIESPYPDCDFSLSYQAVTDAHLHDVFSRSVDFDFPVTILHGKQDDVVLPQLSMKFKRHARSKVNLEILEKADHRLTDHSDHIVRALDSIWQNAVNTD